MLRLILAIPVLFLAAAAAAGDASPDTVTRLSEPVVVTDTYEDFGSPLADSGNALSLRELLADEQAYLGREVLVETRIAKVCQKKGCFFIAQEGEAVARVTFADYGFFIPTDAGGKRVTLAGVFERRELGPAQRRHLAEDLGEPAPAEPAPTAEYHIVASSVRIRRS